MTATFSKIYLTSDPINEDSRRLRNRINRFKTTLFSQLGELGVNIDDVEWRIFRFIEEESGAEIPLVGGEKCLERFIDQCEVRDLLDLITYIHSCLTFAERWLKENRDDKINFSKRWTEFVEQAFRQEGCKYTIGEDGIVHYYVDSQFEAEKVSALAGMSAERYANAKMHFQKAHDAISQETPDTRNAVREIFEAVENISKLIDRKISRLGAAEVEKSLKNICFSLAVSEQEKDFTKKLLDGFKEWVNAHQSYRHASGSEQPSPPSLELAVLSIAQGTGYLRYLIAVDGKNQIA